MDISIAVVSIVVGIAVAMAIIAAFTLQHSLSPQNVKSGKTWLFENWQLQIYDTLFRGKDPSDIGKSIGIDVAKYNHNCMLIKQKNRLKHVIIDKLCGFTIIGISAIIMIISVNPFVILIGLIASFPLIALPIHRVESAADKRRFAIADELPRFLDMLHSALIIGMPVNQAIEITAQNLPDTVLAEELLQTLAETQVGAYSWQEALEKLANNYQVDSFSDFVLDITNAYSLGASIQDSVARKSKDIKETNLMAMKERASKLTNTILFPILLFKILPILAIMAVPIILELKKSGF